MKNEKSIKFRLIALFYMPDQDIAIEYEEIIDTTCTRVEQVLFIEKLFKSDNMPPLNTPLGEYTYDFCVTNKYFNAMEFAIYEPISKEAFDALWLKWKALLTQKGLL